MVGTEEERTYVHREKAENFWEDKGYDLLTEEKQKKDGESLKDPSKNEMRKGGIDMAVIKPFCAIRPQATKAARIAALPYDVFTEEEARKEVEQEPLSFLKIDRPETQFSRDIDMYSPQVYKRAQETLWKMLEEGDFCQDVQKCFYIYELKDGDHVQTGLTACASIDDYQDQVIKRHENTRAEKEEDRIRHIEACQAQTGPIFLAYRTDPQLCRLIEIRKRSFPSYQFVSKDGIRHRIWVVYEGNIIEKIEDIFRKIDQIYIADGHHRAAAAVKVGLEKRRENPMYTGKEPFNYFMCVLFPCDELRILEYNRVVNSLNGLEPQEFLEKVKQYFLVEETGEIPMKPQQKGCFGMYLDKKWYHLKVKEEYVPQDAVKGLDVSILQDLILGPVLGVQEPRTDPRIGFVGGIRGISPLMEQTDREGGVAFMLYPTDISELMQVADEGRLMPPKSTWFEPKLRSGLFIHRI